MTDPKLFLRSLSFAVGLGLSTVLYTPVILCAFPLPLLKRYRMVSHWTRFNLWWLKLSCGLGYRVEGAEHVPTTAAVVLAKHQSAWETLALQLSFDPLVWVLKRELLWLPFFGWGLAMLQPIAIDRGNPRRAVSQLIGQGTKRLQDGYFVAVFPEGTRVAPGERGNYQTGGALLGKQSGVPLIPVAHNAGDFWPRRSFIKRPGMIRLIIGPAIDTRDRTVREINRLAETWIEETVARIRAEERAAARGANAATALDSSSANSRA